jgi:hypothetical protein
MSDQPDLFTYGEHTVAIQTHQAELGDAERDLGQQPRATKALSDEHRPAAETELDE